VLVVIVLQRIGSFRLILIVKPLKRVKINEGDGALKRHVGECRDRSIRWVCCTKF
jgi:hypothetical protein